MILSLPVTGVFNTNAYFYVDDATGHGFLLEMKIPVLIKELSAPQTLEIA